MKQDELLDNEIEFTSSLNSRLSFYSLISTIVIILVFFYIVSRSISNWILLENYLYVYKSSLVLAGFVSSLSGFLFALISIVKQEKSSSIKKVSLIGNFLLFTLFLAIYAFKY